MNDRQAWAIERASIAGQVRGRDIREHFDVSGECARLDLAALVRQGLLHRQGANSGTRYTANAANAKARVIEQVLSASRAELAAVEHLLGTLARG